jgi:uncharacterized protein (DUF58 family)
VVGGGTGASCCAASDRSSPRAELRRPARYATSHHGCGATRVALRFLRHRGHEVLVFHLLDPGERELPGIGDARFVDPETDEELPVSVADLRTEYREAVRRALEEWKQTLTPLAIDYVLVPTDQPMVHALRAYLHKRERLG